MAEATAENPLAKLGKDQGKDAITGYVKDKAGDEIKNTWGRVCTWGFKSDKARNRCEAFSHLYDAGTEEADVVGDAKLGLATSESVVGPIFYGGKAVWDQFKAVDDTGAFIRQVITGKKTDNLHDKWVEAAEKKGADALNSLGNMYTNNPEMFEPPM